MKVVLQNVRLAFPNLFTAATINGEGKPAFSCSLLLTPDHPALKELEKAGLAVAKEKWGVKGEAQFKAIKAADKFAVHDGDSKSQYEGFEGNKFVSCRSAVRPTTLDRNKTPLTEADGKLYSGCYVNAIIELWPQDNKYGKRVNAQIRGVQFFADGDAFSGGGTGASEDEFDDLGVANGDDPSA